MEECDLNEIYDQKLLVKGSLASYMGLVLYLPIGLALVALRLVLSFVCAILVAISPGLKTSSHFVIMYANLIGVHVNSSADQVSI